MHDIYIFDLGGTLIDPKNFDFLGAFKYLSEESGKEITMDQLQAIYEKMFSRNVEEYPFSKILKFLGISFDDERKIEDEFAKRFYELGEIKGAAPLLELVKSKNKKIYALSNTLFSSDHLKMELATFGLDKYFDGIHASAELGFRKPAKEAFLKLAELEQIDLSKAIFIGDHYEIDFIGTKGLLDCFLIGSKNMKYQDEVKCFDDLYALADWIKENE